MPAEAVAGAFISGVTKFVFDTLRDRINRKEKAQRERDLETFRSEARLRETERESLVRRYPFGEPGRLKNFYRVDQRPCVLISPLRSALVDAPGIGEDIFEILSEAPSASMFHQTIPDATVQDAAGLRVVRSSDVVEVAAHEFPRQPALIIHFEERAAGSAMVATAFFWRLFPTTTGDSAFSTKFARFNVKAGRRRANGVEPTGSLSFAQIDLPRATDERMHVIASHVALFAAAVLDLYWKERGTESGLFDALRAAEPHGAQTPRATAPSFETRVAAELEGLKRAQFAVSRESLAGGGCRLTVPLRASLVQVDLPNEFPTAPPVVRLIASGATVTKFSFDDGEWTPARNLVEVMGVFAQL